MKQFIKTIPAKFYFTMIAFFATISTFAQDSSGGSTSSTTTQTSTTTMHIEPWMWIVGAAVFLIILIALLRGGKNRDSVTVSRTTTVENSDV